MKHFGGLEERQTFTNDTLSVTVCDEQRAAATLVRDRLGLSSVEPAGRSPSRCAMAPRPTTATAAPAHSPRGCSPIRKRPAWRSTSCSEGARSGAHSLRQCAGAIHLRLTARRGVVFQAGSRAPEPLLVAGDVEGLAEPSLALTLPKQPTELDDGS
jgi:hypothetical protein